MKKILFFLLLISIGLTTTAQTVSIDHYNIDQGTQLVVPVNLQNLNNVGALTLFVGYDNTVLQFDTVLNVHTSFNGLLANNMNDMQIGMVWSAFLSGVTLSSGQLCELRFNYLGGDCDLEFRPGCEIADYNAITLPAVFVDGSASQIITASFSGLTSGYCADHAPVQISGIPSGGTFTVDGSPVTAFDPSDWSIGAHTVAYSMVNSYGFGDTATQTVEVYSVPSVGIQSQDVLCFGDNTGSVEAIVNQGTAPFTYSWSNGQSAQTALNLYAGNHTVSVSDANGCADTESVTLQQGPEIVASLQVTHASSLTASDGAINLTASGGNPPYAYSWSNGSTTEDLTTLAYGTFQLTISDADACTIEAEERVRIESSQLITIPNQWCIISFNIDLYNPSVVAVMAPIVDSISIVKNGLGHVYWPEFGVNLIGDIIKGQGYQVKPLAGQILNAYGFYLFPEEEEIVLPSGWSMIGYLRNVSGDVEVGLANINQNIDIFKNDIGLVYWPQFGLNMVPSLDPGEGYQIKMLQADTLIYPAN